MAGIGHYNYAGIPLQEKYGWFQSGPGATAAAQTGDSLKRIAARLDVSDATIGAGFIERKLGTSWEGGAAQAASGAFDRAAAVLASLSTSSLSGGGTAQQFGDSFNATKNAIPVPPPSVGVNSTAGAMVDDFVDSAPTAVGNGMRALGMQSDFRARLVANRNAELVADDALQRHEDTSRDVLAGYQSAAGPSTPGAAPSGAAPTGAVQPSARTTGGAATSGGSAGRAGAGGGRAAAGGGTAAGAGHSGAAAGAGHPGTSGRDSSAGGTTAGAGSHGGASTGTASAGAAPPPGGSGAAPGANGGLGANGGFTTNGTNGYAGNGGYGTNGGTAGGYLPTGGGYQPGGTYQPGSSSWTPGRYGGGTGGGYRNIAGEEPLAPRTGGEPNPAVRGGTGAAGSAGTAPAAVGTRAGQGGMAPMGMGGAGAGSGDREHRNQFYIPEDEPFRIEYDFYVAPPVLGAGASSDDWDGQDVWDGRDVGGVR